ncbi:hypothetical protein GAYE_SCF55G6298 [Galdieria yellowstonensis]|uniref:Uncharacterized protein n=1 Tax=Galdieria yellowstonensis TaxID=3028027 RepID=A0AAV9ILJ8_9RHOD|nr:hypothetical protein GAYE_SCF55G6298 [Galdieria yellowstonensis]
MGKAKKQKEKKVVSLAEFNASLGLDPMKPLELQSLPTAPRGESGEQRDFSKVRRDGGHGGFFGKREDESGDGRRRAPKEKGETDAGWRDLDWTQARQGKPVEKDDDSLRKGPSREVDFSAARQGAQVIGEDAVETSLKNKRNNTQGDRDFSLLRKKETNGDELQQQERHERDFSNVRKGETISNANVNNNAREVDFSCVRRGAHVIEAPDPVPPKKTGDVDFGNVRKNAQPITQAVRSNNSNNHNIDKPNNIDFTNARSGSRVISSVEATSRKAEESGKNESQQMKDYKKSMKSRPPSASRDLDFSKLRVRE